jgi:hypothetical protein
MEHGFEFRGWWDWFFLGLVRWISLSGWVQVLPSVKDWRAHGRRPARLFLGSAGSLSEDGWQLASSRGAV